MLYLGSLATPAFACGPDAPTSGLAILASGWIGILAGDPRWYANPIFVAVVARVMAAGELAIHDAWRWVSIVAVALAAFSLVSPAAVCDRFGTPGNHTGVLIAPYLWLGAMMCAAVLAHKQGD